MTLTREMVQAMLDSGNFDAVMDELCRHWLATQDQPSVKALLQAIMEHHELAHHAVDILVKRAREIDAATSPKESQT